MFRRIKNVFGIIKQGDKFQDKFSIFLYYLLKQFGWKKMPFNVIIKNSAGTFSCAKNPGWVGCSSERYETEVQKELKLKSGVFFDVGANIGRFGIDMANKSDKVKVIAFEP